MINVEGYWIELGTKKAFEDDSYVLTKSVKQNMKDLYTFIFSFLVVI